jgi:hypothetical protein
VSTTVCICVGSKAGHDFGCALSTLPNVAVSRKNGKTVMQERDFNNLLNKLRTAPQRCLLAGHYLDEGQEIASCVICSQEGCCDCLDTHDCHDYEVIL